MSLLIQMGLEKQEVIEVAAAVTESQDRLRLFMRKLLEKNFQMTPEEVYEASLETVNEIP